MKFSATKVSVVTLSSEVSQPTIDVSTLKNAIEGLAMETAVAGVHDAVGDPGRRIETLARFFGIHGSECCDAVLRDINVARVDSLSV
jgi:hypothetical protein